MSKLDSILWSEFIKRNGKDFESFDYDLPVGDGSPVEVDTPTWLAKDWSDLTKKRIDAVGYRTNGAALFEVKPRAGTSALGQLLTYQELFKISFPRTTIISLNVVCQTILPEEILLYTTYKINVYQFELSLPLI